MAITYFVAVPLYNVCDFFIISVFGINVEEVDTSKRFGINIVGVGDAKMGERCRNIHFVPVQCCHIPFVGAYLNGIPCYTTTSNFIAPVISLYGTLT